jgi:MFS family permease
MTDSTTRNADDAKSRRRAIIASYLGTTLEYYDFLLYGVASALVFPKIFFVSMDPLLATLSAFATFAVGYFARPAGAIVFGHFGDIIGRRAVLVITMLMMGISSVLIGLLPGYDQWGLAAPIALVVLRLVQGFAIGGEWGGATLMSMEHAKPKGRGFAVSVVASGGPSGAVLGTLVMTPFSMLPTEAFLSWGWRIPFLLSALLVVIGLVVRSQVSESPEYEAARKARAAKPRSASEVLPVVKVFRHAWKEVLSGFIGGLAPLGFATFAAAFLLNYAVSAGHARPNALIAMTIANFVHIFTTPLFGAMSDRLGRRPLMISGAVLGMLLIWPIFLLVEHGGFFTLLLALLLALPLVQAMMGGTYNTWISEKFAADIRYSGVALTFQLASTLGAGLAPLVATSLLAASGGQDPRWVALFFGGLCLVSCITYVYSRDNANRTLAVVTGEAAPAEAPPPAGVPGQARS